MSDGNHTLIILTSLLVVIATYIAFSRRIGNYANVLLPSVIFLVPACYLFELMHGFLYGYQQSEFAYLYCYIAYPAGVIARAVGYLCGPGLRLPIFPKLRRFPLPSLHWLMLGVGILLYVPILIKFSAFITSPRQIYEQTREGFGIEFFLSTFAVYLGLILLLFAPGVRRGGIIVFSILSLLILYLHGSKAQLLYFALIGLYYCVFVLQWKFGIGRLILLGGVSGTIVLTLFWITFPPILRAEFLASIARYSDYSRNAAMTIDDVSLDPQLGRLTMEGSVYALMPRAWFPEKPKDFGTFWLAERYYPGTLESAKGAPAFGFGLLYADFGVFSLAYYIVTAFIVGMMLKILAVRLRQRADAGTFLLMLPLLDVVLIPTDAPFVAYYMFAIVAWVFSRDRPSNTAGAAAPAAQVSALRPAVSAE